jgi:propanol-preferring alcohol dehydrogenase
VGDRVGVPWLAHTRGVCGFCWTGRESLCVDPRFTGRDACVGYAEYLMVDAAYADSLPEGGA